MEFAEHFTLSTANMMCIFAESAEQLGILVGCQSNGNAEYFANAHEQCAWHVESWSWNHASEAKWVYFMLSVIPDGGTVFFELKMLILHLSDDKWSNSVENGKFLNYIIISISNYIKASGSLKTVENRERCAACAEWIWHAWTGALQMLTNSRRSIRCRLSRSLRHLLTRN